MSGLLSAFVFAAVVVLLVVVVPVALSRARMPNDALETGPARTSRPVRPRRGVAGTPWRVTAAVWMFSCSLPLSIWVEVGAGRADDVPHVAAWTLMSSPLLFVLGRALGQRIVRTPQSVPRRKRMVDARTFE